MSSAIVSLISIAIILFGTLAMSQGSFSAVEAISGSWKQAGEWVGEIRRTDLAPVVASVHTEGQIVEITLRNEGEAALGDFPRWDVVVQYYGADGNYYIKWLPYTEGAPDPENNEWAVSGIYLDAQGGTPEVFEPGILNPQEEVVIQIGLTPGVEVDSTNWAIIVTPNGVVTSVAFNG
ncbi:MAG TPA: hypothetical protein G4O03_03815 [Dehalococcoidia bacterium]|nr:hypothetical protein [Dehalococcoidia bacterium]